MKRIFLFAVTNLAVLVLLSIVVRVLGLDALLAQQGIGADALLLFAAVIGFGGALIVAAGTAWRVRHLGKVRRRLSAPLHESSTARGAHRCASRAKGRE